ncbi:MAG TPA: SDR family NAD(P)-dependent oxidoreductase, partial [Blastocatellia bacterium]|nr:SDR family NAD(P)-dependent oxidoreductase [Blastocatellia bacterium]
MTRPLNEQVVVITGASSGIGRVTARMLGERGARIVVASRNLSSLTEVAEEINQAGGQGVACQTDVSDSSQVQRLANTALAHFGRIDTWINNAGVSLYATFDKVSEAEARRIMDVNFMGTFHGMQ